MGGRGEKRAVDAAQAAVTELIEDQSPPGGGGGEQGLAGGGGQLQEVGTGSPAHLMDQLVFLVIRAPATGSPLLMWALMAALSGAVVTLISN